MTHASRGFLRLLLPAVLIAGGTASPAAGQEGVAFTARALFFGDNTEFRNPFREGETIFGAAAWLAAEIPLNERVTLVAGGFGARRHGSGEAFDIARPVLTLRIGGARSTLIMGTLETPLAGDPAGPDRTGPHGLLPPLQRETLAFERPYEGGLQWKFSGRTLRHDAWINWQRLNTSAHRERFDAGVAGEAAVTSWLAIPFQAHVVHEGGQLFDTGPVADSTAFGSGAIVRGDVRGTGLTLEAHGLLSRYVPDREAPSRFIEGSGGFWRAAAARWGLRAHLLLWSARNFVKVEGDPNYLSLTQGGERHRGTRRYAEAGLTRTFRPASEAIIETSARLHRVEGRHEYSFRVLGVVDLRRPR